MENFSQSLPIITFFGMITVLVSNVFFSWRQGVNQSAKDTITLLQAQVTTLKETNVTQANQIKDLVSNLGKLQGVVEEKEKKLADYLAILKGQDPEQKKFIEEGFKTMSTVKVLEPVITNMQKDILHIKQALSQKVDK